MSVGEVVLIGKKLGRVIQEGPVSALVHLEGEDANGVWYPQHAIDRLDHVDEATGGLHFTSGTVILEGTLEVPGSEDGQADEEEE